MLLKIRLRGTAPGVAVATFALFCLHPQLNRCLAFPDGQSESANAAVKYLRADAALRQSYAMAPDAATKLEGALGSPLDDKDQEIVAAAGEALVEFHHAAALKSCDWIMSIEDGPAANTAHRGAVRELVAVAGIRARLRFRGGDSQRAMSDALAAIAAARHLSLDGSLASVLISYRLENEITKVLAENLHQFSQPQLGELLSGLGALPTGSNLGTALEAEKVGRNDFLAIAQHAKNRNELIDGLSNGIPVLQGNHAVAAEIVDGCGGSTDGFESCISQQQSFYSSVTSQFSLPPTQFEKQFKAEINEFSKTNPLISRFTPALANFRWTEAYNQTRWALLLAAVDVQLEGSKALDKYPDPYDAAPFTYSPITGGFRLESRLSEKGTPLSLSIITGS